MTINTALLIAAPMLQDLLVDKDGTPMAGGTITLYHDNSRTTLKNWYYQSGTPGNYTYVPLPNPLKLSAAGTITDINGVDTIPFYYPYDETDESIFDPYYITIINYAQTNQITRANFPFVGTPGGSVTTLESFNNLIVNNGFWRNIAPNNLTNTPNVSFNYSNTILTKVVAPSQHDGFKTPDILFARSNNSATEAVTFVPFPSANSVVIPGFSTPEYYLSHTTSAAGTGETFKYYQFPIALHLNNLANLPFTFSLQAQNAGGTSTGQNVITVFLLQDTGTGTTPPAAAEIGQISLSTSWTNYTISSIFPSTVGLSLSNASDDAFYIQIGIPLNLTCTINFTKPALYLTQNSIPTNEIKTYDQVDAIISSPRTGDVRTSINQFYNYGWVPMNDGTLGNVHSNATAYGQQDAWPLFNLLWQTFNALSTGGNSLIPIYTSAGSPSTFGANALSDWNGNKALGLTKLMGKVMLGTVPQSALLAATPSVLGYSSVVTASSSTGLLWTTASSNLLNIFAGNTVIFSSTTSLVNVSANTVYYMIPISSTSFKVATSFANALAGTAVSYTGVETGTVTAFSQQTGSGEGEYAHTQLVGELAAHTHPTTTPATLAAGTTLGNAINAGTLGNSGSTGSSNPFNVTQPATFYNMFIKL